MNSMSRVFYSQTRREFIKRTTLVTTALTAGPMSWPAAGAPPAGAKANLPWYRRTLRWGQTNITEIDPIRYDIAWWRKHWKHTHTQGVIINAGGIVAYATSWWARGIRCCPTRAVFATGWRCSFTVRIWRRA